MFGWVIDIRHHDGTKEIRPFRVRAQAREIARQLRPNVKSAIVRKVI